MRIRSRHQRRLQAPPERVGALVAALGSDDDVLWPGDRWPPLRLDGPLAPGAAGGHGPIRYRVEEHLPGRRVTFRFTGPAGLAGTHAFEISPQGDGTLLAHIIEGSVRGRMLFLWPLVYRPLHDALLEDALANAAGALGEAPERPHWSRPVRALRRLLAGHRPGPAAL